MTIPGLCFMLGLVCSVQCQEIGWEERLQNDLFCFVCDIKLNSVLSVIVKSVYLASYL